MVNPAVNGGSMIGISANIRGRHSDTDDCALDPTLRPTASSIGKDTAIAQGARSQLTDRDPVSLKVFPGIGMTVVAAGLPKTSRTAPSSAVGQPQKREMVRLASS